MCPTGFRIAMDLMTSISPYLKRTSYWFSHAWLPMEYCVCTVGVWIIGLFNLQVLNLRGPTLKELPPHLDLI